MKKIVLLFVLVCFVAFGFATTYNTITLGTDLTDWDSDEKFSTSTTSKYNYITWDETNLYFGFDGVNITDNSGYNQSLFIVLDTDPQYTINTGNGSTNLGYEQWFRGSTVNVPFNADFIFAVKADNYSASSNVYVYNNTSSSWDKNPGGAPSISVDWSSSNFEASISLSDIGNPSKIYVTTYAKDLSSNDGWGWLYSVLDGGITDGNNDKTLTKWRAYTLTTSISPNSTGSDTPLPICLSSFTATALKGKVNLAWTTESETENSHFLVYRDGDVIGRVDGAGTSTEPHDYAFTDDKVLPGVHEYAIADVSYGGVEELHESVEVEVKDEAEAKAEAGFVLEKAYPNPFNPRTAISYRLTTNSTIDMSIYSTGGEKVSTLFNGEQTVGRHQLIWDATGVPSGIYVVRMLAGNMVETMKVVLMK
jgi:hypothetical protein